MIRIAICDDDGDGYCDEPGCSREFVCNHVDDDEDNYCDYCSKVINCTHESVFMHICEICCQKVTDCYDGDGDLWCDDCWEMVECQQKVWRASMFATIAMLTSALVPMRTVTENVICPNISLIPYSNTSKYLI